MNRITAAARLLSFSEAKPSTQLTASFLVSNYGRLCSRMFKINRKSNDVHSHMRLRCAFSSLSSSQDLTSKKCVPCNSKDIQPISEQSANELLSKVQGWEMSNDVGVMKLHRSWKVKSFMKGLDFFKLVADVAEAEGHHPDLHLVGWNNVKIDIWTHSVGGLTENDFILAAKINSLEIEHLLSKKGRK